MSFVAIYFGILIPWCIFLVFDGVLLFNFLVLLHGYVPPSKHVFSGSLVYFFTTLWASFSFVFHCNVFMCIYVIHSHASS